MAQKSRIFRLFVSSTFSDMVVERNALQEHVYPRLRQLCARHGARFQAIDLRWGISQEAGLNQRATDVCLNEISRCQRVTNRPNFLLLMGDRYGWQPLPDDIPVDEWDTLITCMTSDEQTALQRWYLRDDSAVPPIYVLQPRTGEYIDQNTWNVIETRLRQILLKALAGLNWSREKHVKYETSVTEQEIIKGIFENPNAEQCAFCFFRNIEGLPNTANQFIDTDLQAHAKLADLKQRLQKYLPDNIQQYQAQWMPDGITTDHIEHLCEDVYARLSQAILTELATFHDVSDLDIEREAHHEFMLERTRHFIGRTDILQAITQYRETKEQKTSFFIGILRKVFTSKQQFLKPHKSPLVLYGQSGVGKSTVMARAILEVPDALYRFIGITPDSSNIRLLLMSLCQEIAERYQSTQSVPQDYEELIKVFPVFLALANTEKPLTIFLDALDQLSNSNTPSNLRWMPRELPPNVKLIASAIPSPILTVLKELHPKTLLGILPMQEADAERLLDLWLQEACRTLTPMHRAEVLHKFAQNGLPLYLKLAFEEARLWRSYEQKTLYSDVSSLIRDNLFARLSSPLEHGELLISRSMGYLSASRNGLSEEEILEILALDEKYWTAFSASAFHAPIRRQVPIVLWSRIAFDLAPYMIERGEDNSSLLSFYHRQFSEAVDAIYLKDVREARHAHLAHYFESQSLYAEKIPNSRKTSEQAYQEAKANLHNSYVATLTDFHYLQASLDSHGVPAIVEDCELREDRTLKSIASTLIMSAHILAHSSEQLSNQFVGRLSSYDAMETIVKEASAYETSKPNLKLISPSLIATGRELVRTLEGHMDTVCSVALSGDFAVSASTDHTLRVWNWRTGRLVRTLEGHVDSVWSVALSGDFAVSASTYHTFDTLRVWNWRTGEQLRVLRRLWGQSYMDVCVALTAEFAVTASDDHTLRVWNWQSGKRLRVLKGHTHQVLCVALSGDFAVSASADHTLRAWNWRTGKLLRTLEGHMGSVWSVALSGEFAVSASNDHTLRVWNWHTGELLRTLEGHMGTVRSVALSGDFAVSASHDASLRVWNWRTGEALPILGRLPGGFLCVALSGDFAVSASDDHTLRVWNWQGIERSEASAPADSSQRDEAPRSLGGHTDAVLSVALSGDFAVSASVDKTLRVWNGRTGEPLQTLAGHAGAVRNVALSGDFAVSTSADRTLRVWNWCTGELLRTLVGHTDTVMCVALSEDFALSGSADKTLRVWNWRTGELLRTIENSMRSDHVALSGDFAVSATSGWNLRVWNWRTGELLRRLEGHTRGVNSVALSGDFAVSASSDKTLRVWNWHTGEPLRTLVGHTDTIISVALSGDFALSGSDDHTLRLWNWQRGQLITVFYADSSQQAVTIAEDASVIVSGGRDGKVHFLRPNKELMKLLRTE